VPFLRFARDKRGYEHTYLVHESGGRGRPARARVLYWFRTPPGIRVGREPFDEEARRRIELHNPGVTFDWKAIASTPIPPVPEVEHWRERRRIERAAKVARREEQPDSDSPEAQAEAPGPVAFDPAPPLADVREPAPVGAEGMITVVPEALDQARKRRRRRGGRRRTAAIPVAASGPGDAPTAPGSEPEASNTFQTALTVGSGDPQATPYDPPESRPDTSQE
jgi:hypothetical protein